MKMRPRRRASRSSRRDGRAEAGSYHLMFVGLKEPFEKGKRVKGTLQFEKAGTVEVNTRWSAGGTPGMNRRAQEGIERGG